MSKYAYMVEYVSSRVNGECYAYTRQDANSLNQAITMVTEQAEVNSDNVDPGIFKRYFRARTKYTNNDRCYIRRNKPVSNGELLEQIYSIYRYHSGDPCPTTLNEKMDNQ